MKRPSLVVLAFTLCSFSLVRSLGGGEKSLGGGFEGTSLFNITASSTCGLDTPTSISNCSNEDHSVTYASDRNLSTWWQSEEADDPALVNFTLKV